MRKEPFTREYLLGEILQFRNWMGEQSFWVGSKPQNSMKGLFYCYVNTVGLKDDDVSLVEATLKEYSMRSAYLLASGRYSFDT